MRTCLHVRTCARAARATCAIIAPVVALEGTRCTVRTWRKSDAVSLVQHANNVNVAKHLRDRFPHPYTERDAKAFLKHVTATDDTSNLAIDVAGEAVGAVGFVPGRDIERFSAEIGYWLGEDLWGRGIVTEALSLVTSHVFSQLNFLRLYALPFADNPASVQGAREGRLYARGTAARQQRQIRHPQRSAPL